MFPMQEIVQQQRRVSGTPSSPPKVEECASFLPESEVTERENGSEEKMARMLNLQENLQ